MPYPPEIALVACTVGGASALESGTQLVLSAEITSSRGLMWGATGWQFPSITRTVTGTEGAELSFSLPPTDLAGWRLLDDSGSTIDVSTPGSYTHTYTIRLTTLLSGRPVGQRTIGPFVLPAGSGPVDLDTMLPVGTVAGGVVLVPGTWDARVAAAEAAAGIRAHVIVGDGGDYATVSAALAAYPAGNVEIEVKGGTIVEPGPIAVAGVKNVTIRGQGRGVSVLEFPGGAFDATTSSDAWVIRDLHVKHSTGNNTDDGIRVDYPRRWLVERVNVTGFGGSSIWYRGGIHSVIQDCHIVAEDSTGVNGYAGVRIDRSAALIVPTTIASVRNYVAEGVQYGHLTTHANVGCTFAGNIAERCAVGMRFETCGGTILDPYTEANTVGVELHDSQMQIIGRLRDEPVVTWAGVAAADRRIVRISRDLINPGKGLVYGGALGATDMAANASIQWGGTTPEGSVTAVPGSLYIRITGATAGRALYVKESGTGNTGWVAYGSPKRAGTEFNALTNSVNTEGKHEGQMAFNTTTNRPVWAAGPAAADLWLYADGTTAHTPA